PGGPGGPGGRPGGRPGGPRGGPQQRRGRKQKRRRRQREELQPQELASYTPVDAPVPEGEVVIERGSTAQEIAGKLNRSAADVVRFLLQQGEMVTATQSLSDDMVELFAAELGAQIRIVDPGAEQEAEILKVLDIDLEASGSAPRPPVITVMGHVDHGKTLLLDRIRSSNVVEGEAGGITQHIGAYQVERNGQALTFIDTPGHAAFTSMRARGAQATDIVILVVAADDGVMPQTLEAIDHARAAEVPIVVAINKMDREGVDPNRVLAQLAERDLIPESYGGEVITVPISAMTEDGIDELLDQIILVAELEDLRAAPDGRAIGTVLEANLDRGRGPVATVLVQQGTLLVGDPMVAGAAWGRVRAMTDDRGNAVKEAGPSAPVEVLGLSEVPRSGDVFTVAPDEKTASRVADTREHWQRQASMASASRSGAGGAKLEDIFQQIRAGEAATLNLVLKADVHGSLEAVTDSLRKLEREEVKLSFVSRGVGGVNENDVQLAIASNATILGFNVRPDRKAREAAESENVEIRLYEIIYQLLEDIENAMLGMLEPEFEEIVTGEAHVREVFRISRVGPIAGCFVEHGTISDGAKVRFLREGTIIWKGEVASLRHFQDSVPQVNAGMECGIGLSDFTDLKEGDVIETYDEREIPRT
ncbi:MAG: translation initiation factor IF-2, partial [Actinomycetota bacterium]|nr:translation initiation factor IF-2 [Actinomycetota bacterium]